MHVHALQQIVTDGLCGLHTESMDIGRCVVTSEGRQINARDSFQQPGSLQYQCRSIKMASSSRSEHVT